MALRQRTDLRPTIPDENFARSKPTIKPTRIGHTTMPIRRPALGQIDANKQQNSLAPTNTKPKAAIKPVAAKPALKKEAIKPPVKPKPVAPKQEFKPTATRAEARVIPKHLSVINPKPVAIIDPDVSSRNDPLLVVEYLPEIFAYLRKMENDFPINEGFLVGHKVTAKMRAILIDWLVGAHQNFKLAIETLYLCVSIVDRYLQNNKREGRDTLQLVGTAALFVACKYEEMYLPDIEDFVYICDDTFSKRQIFAMEILILKSLDYSFGRPLPIHFLRRYSKVGGVTMKSHVIAKYMLELALLDYTMAHVKPSIQAAAASCFAMALVADELQPKKVWTPTLVHYTTYEYSDLRPVMIDLAVLLVDSNKLKHRTIIEKYSSPTHLKISVDPILTGLLTTTLANLKKKVSV